MYGIADGMSSTALKETWLGLLRIENGLLVSMLWYAQDSQDFFSINK
jgi:hypothetical protein